MKVFQAQQFVPADSMGSSPWISGSGENIVEADAFLANNEGGVTFYLEDGTQVATFDWVFRVQEMERDEVGNVTPVPVANEEIETRFTYHAPFGTQPERFVQIRNAAKRLAYLLKDLTPGSREQSLSLTALEESVFWANAAIARREERGEVTEAPISYPGFHMKPDPDPGDYPTTTDDIAPLESPPF